MSVSHEYCMGMERKVDKISVLGALTCVGMIDEQCVEYG